MLLLWGAFLSLYPGAADLNPYIAGPLSWLGFGCFVLGAIGAAVGVTDFTDSAFVRLVAPGIACLFVAYGLHVAAARIGLGSPWSAVPALLAIPCALVGLGIICQGITVLVESASVGRGSEPALAPVGKVVQTNASGEKQFEHLASIVVAALGVVGALFALAKSVVDGWPR